MTHAEQQQQVLADLAEWYRTKDELTAIKAKESALRTKIFTTCFPTPVEGAKNIYGLPDGYVLKATHVINRSIDEAAFQAIRQPYFEKFGQSADRMVKTKMELKSGEYKAQTEEEKALFDEAVTAKPGSPQLEIIAPKKKE